MPNVANARVRIGPDLAAFRQELIADLQEALAGVRGEVTVTADLDTSAAQAKADSFAAGLQSTLGKMVVTPTVNLDIAPAELAAGAISASLDRLDNRMVTAIADLDITPAQGALDDIEGELDLYSRTTWTATADLNIGPAEASLAMLNAQIADTQRSLAGLAAGSAAGGAAGAAGGGGGSRGGTGVVADAVRTSAANVALDSMVSGVTSTDQELNDLAATLSSSDRVLTDATDHLVRELQVDFNLTAPMESMASGLTDTTHSLAMTDEELNHLAATLSSSDRAISDVIDEMVRGLQVDYNLSPPLSSLTDTLGATSNDFQAIRPNIDKVGVSLSALEQALSAARTSIGAEAINRLAAQGPVDQTTLDLLSRARTSQGATGVAAAMGITGLGADAAGGRGGSGDKGGGGLIRGALWGAGLGGLAGVGTVGSLAGFGAEHAAVTGVGLAGLLGGAALGAGVIGAGAAGIVGTGMGIDSAVLSSTLGDTKNVSAAYEHLQRALAVYGAGSIQATAAQYDLNAAFGGVTPAAGAAEMALGSAGRTLDNNFDKATSNARVVISTLGQEILGLANTFLPWFGQSATRNFTLISAGLQPLLQWFSGPGRQIFKNFENIFAQNLPRSLDIFTQGVEFLLKTMNYATRFTGGFTQKLDELIRKANGANFSKWEGIMNGWVADFHVVSRFVVQLVKDIYQLFHLDAGTAAAIVTYLTQMLARLHDYLTSTTGAAAVHNLFEVHKQEIIALLGLIVSLASTAGHILLTVEPPFIMIATTLLQAAGAAVSFLTHIGGGVGTLFSFGLGLAFIANKISAFALLGAGIGFFTKQWDYFNKAGELQTTETAFQHLTGLLSNVFTQIGAMPGRLGGAWSAMRQGQGAIGGLLARLGTLVGTEEAVTGATIGTRVALGALTTVGILAVAASIFLLIQHFGVLRGLMIGGAVAVVGLTIAFWALDAVPIVALIAAIGLAVVGLVAGLIWLAKNWSQVWGDIKHIFDDVVGFLRTGIGAALVSFIPFIGLPLVIAANWSSIAGFFVKLWNDVIHVFDSSLHWIESGWDSVWHGMSSVVSGVWHGIEDVIFTQVNVIINIINGLIRAFDAVTSFVPGVPHINTIPHLTIPGRAAGGPVDPKQPYLVGEKGPEVMVPRTSGTIIPHAAATAASAAGGSSVGQFGTIAGRTVVQYIAQALQTGSPLVQQAMMQLGLKLPSSIQQITPQLLAVTTSAVQTYVAAWRQSVGQTQVTGQQTVAAFHAALQQGVPISQATAAQLALAVATALRNGQPQMIQAGQQNVLNYVNVLGSQGVTQSGQAATLMGISASAALHSSTQTGAQTAAQNAANTFGQQLAATGTPATQSAAQAVGSAFQNYPFAPFAQSAANTAGTAFQNSPAFPTAGTSAASTVGADFANSPDLPLSFNTAGQNAATSFGNGLFSIFPNIFKKLGDFYQLLHLLPDPTFTQAFNSPTAWAFPSALGLGGGRAAGGPVDPHVPVMVGEKGPEIFAPHTAGTIIPNHIIAAGARSSSAPSAAVTQWQSVSPQLAGIWQGIQGRYMAANANQLAATITHGEQIKTVLGNTWQTVRAQSQAIWSDTYGQYQAANTASLAATMATAQQTRSTINSSWQNVRAQSQSTWSQMTSELMASNATQLANINSTNQANLANTTATVTAVKTTTTDAYNQMAGDLPVIVSGMWGKTDQAYRGGIDSTIGDLDKFLGSVNQVGSQVNWAVNLNVPMLAAGGRFDRATAIVGEGNAPEYVLPTDPKHRARSLDLLGGYLKEMGLTKMAEGGVLPPAAVDAASFFGVPYVWGGTSTAGVDCSGLIYLIGQKLGIPLPRTSEAQYAFGPAMPASGAGPGMPIFFNTGASDQAPPQHVGLYVGGGAMIDAPNTGQVVQQESVQGFGSIMGFTNPFGAAAANMPTWTALPTPPTLSGFPNAVANSTAAQATSALAAHQQAYVAQMAAQGAALGAKAAALSAVPGTTSGVVALAQQMAAARGWTGSEWTALYDVIQRESGWDVNAQNPTSTAYGLGQFINGPSQYFTYGGNPSSAQGQLQGTLNYIAQRYGDPLAAWAHETSAGWYQSGGVIPVRKYDKGGMLDPGLTLAVNGTGAPEPVGAGAGAIHYNPTYHLSIVAPPGMDEERLAAAIRSELAEHDAELLNLIGARR